MKPRAHAFLPLLLVACGPEQTAPRQAPPPPKVTVAPIRFQEVVDYSEQTGWLDSAQTVEVRSRVRGHLDKVHFQDGQMVKAGQILFELDPRPFRADIDRAKALVTALEAQQAATQKEQARQQSLLGRGGASQSLVDKLTADVIALGAQVAAQKKEVARLELDLEYSQITSAIDGRIGRAMLTPGNLVNAGGGDQLLATIVSIDPVYLYFTVEERMLQLYRKRHGTSERPQMVQVPCQFGLETDDGYPREGVLDFGDVKIDPGTGTITLRGTVPNPKYELVPGSRVRVRVAISKPRRAAVVPDSALLADQDRRYVLIVDDRNVVHRRDVQPGLLLADGNREVTPRDQDAPAFLESDRLIVNGLLRARVNNPVEPTAAK